MKVAVLFSGGKDSTYAAWLAKKSGHELSCLISIFSKNKESYMFHTPSIKKTEKQAEAMKIPFVVAETEGIKEEELEDLKKVISETREKYGIEGVVTGALASVYQAERIGKICEDLGLESINPLWQKDQIELLEELVRENFEVAIIGVAAYPLGKECLGRKIDEKFIEGVKILQKEYKINPAGEGGEFESFVLNCPLFEKGLKVKGFEDFGEENSWHRELEVE